MKESQLKDEVVVSANIKLDWMSKGGRPKGEEWNHFTEAELPQITSGTNKLNGNSSERNGMTERADSESSECSSVARPVTVCNHCGMTVSNKAARLRAHLKQCNAYLTKYANLLERHDTPLNLAGKKRSLQINLADSSLDENKCEPKVHCASGTNSCSPRELPDKTVLKAAVDIALARFLYGCNLSFNTVENPLLVDLLSKLNPDYPIPSKRTLGNALIEDITGKITDGSDSVSSGTTHSSSSNNGLNYVTINPSPDQFDADLSVFSGATYISKTHGSMMFSPALTSPIRVNTSRDYFTTQSSPEQQNKTKAYN